MNIAVKDVLFFVLYESPEGRVNYAFWLAGCAGAVQDIDRMIWGKERELVFDDAVV